MEIHGDFPFAHALLISVTRFTHLLELARFHHVGACRAELIHFKEEMELTAPLFLYGKLTYHSPGRTFHHRETLTGRDWYRKYFFGARNNRFWSARYLPTRNQLVMRARNAT